jgi:predicted DNA binding protein
MYARDEPACVHRVTFRVGGEGPLVAAAAAHDAAADLWCDDHHDLLRVRGPAADAFLEVVREEVAVRDVLPGDGECVAVTECLADDYAAVDPLVAAHDCVLVPPLSYVDGRRLLRVLAPDGDRLAALYDDLRAEWAVDVVRKTTAIDAGGATPGDSGDPLAGLSDRQREALEVAVAGGYYERPRAIDTADVATTMGVGRRTAAEHLRKAERQVLTALVPSGGGRE